jgi:two-component system response regulator DctR
MTQACAYIVDDDEAIRDALAWLFKSRNVASRSWPSAEDFLADWRDDMRGCLVLDVRMGGMSGPELFDQLRARRSRLPVIFLSGHGDIPLAVAAVKNGAVDFVEKPFNDNELVDRVLQAIARDAASQEAHCGQATLVTRLARLTRREREVMERILAGKYNKVIADELHIAMRTVEVHRARIFEKMAVKSAVELARVVAQRDQP